MQGVISRLILEKSDSKSGVERLAWAMGGLEALRDSWGLGVGMGSIRGNGLVFVALGSVGIAGTLCLGVFLGWPSGPHVNRLARFPPDPLLHADRRCLDAHRDAADGDGA